VSANAFVTGEGLSAALAVTAISTAAPIQVKGLNNNSTQRMFYNAGPNDCWVAGASTAAKAVAVAPTAGTPALGVAIPAGAIVILSFPPGTFFAAISAAAKTATLYITPGEGV
jgi:hypothetical protein